MLEERKQLTKDFKVDAGRRFIKSHCQMCFNACGIIVEVNDGVAVKIMGDPDDPNTNGRLCGRGLSALTRLYDPYRVKAPLVRTNPKKGIGIDPKWKEVSWEEALNIVADKLKRIRKDNPNKLIYLAWPGEKYIQAQAWGHAFGTKNVGFFFSGASNKCANPNHMIGMLAHGALVEFPDLDYCNYLVLMGTEMGHGAHQSFVPLAKKIADARDRGMKLVVVDPRLSVAAAKADEWLPIRPGTDLALFLSMIYLLVHEYKLYDVDFLKKRTNAPYLLTPSGHYVRDPQTGKPMIWDVMDSTAKAFDDPSVKEAALEGDYVVGDVQCIPAFQFLKDQVKTYNPEWASKITTIPEDQICKVTRELAKNAQIGATVTIEGHEYPLRPVAIISYKGLQAHTNGGLAMMAQEIVLMLLGALDVPGGVISKSMDARRFGGQPQLLRADEDGLVRPHATGWEFFTPFKFPPDRLDLGEYCPLAFDLGHLVPLVTLNPTRYGFDYEPEALLIFHSNPLKNCGDLEVMTEALKKLDLVVDITIYLDETCDFADVILPESSFLERYNLINFTYDKVGLQVAQPVVSTLYNSMEGMDILTELAAKIGFLHEWNDRLNKTLALEPPFALELNRKYNWEEILDIQAKCHSGGKKNLDWYKTHGNDFRPMKAEEKYLIYRNARLPLYFSMIKEIGESLAENLEKYKIKERFGLDVRLEQYTALPYWEPIPCFGDDDYDLYLISYQSSLTTYADMATNPIIVEIAERDPYHLTVMVNEETAKKKNIKDGDEIWIESRITKVRAKAKLTKGIHPEVIAISGGFGRWLNHPIAKGKGVVYNELFPIDLRHSGMIGGSMESTVKVKVTKAE